MRERIIYVSEYQPRKQYYAIQEGEKVTLTVDWSAVTDAASTSVSSVEWDDDSANAVSLSNKTLTDNKASALFSGDYCGSEVVVCTATMADGQIRKLNIQIDVGIAGVNR